MAPDGDRRIAVQRWLNSISWEFDPTNYQLCRCGLSFRPTGLAFTCRDCFEKCTHDGEHLLGHIVAVNGARAPHRLCFKCGRLVTLRKGAGPGEYCFRDNRREARRLGMDLPPCARCASTDGVELHHWAPRAIFGFTEADRWPQSYLCVPCHSTWHREIRKAGGYRLPPDERIDDLGSLSALGETA